MKAFNSGGGALGGRQSFPFADPGGAKRKGPSPDWRCTYKSGIHIFASPDYFAARQGKIEEGTVFRVSREHKGSDGVLWLQLADGRGWVFDRSVGGFGTLCVRHEEEEESAPPPPQEPAPAAKTGGAKAQIPEEDTMPELSPGTYVVTTENLKVTEKQSWSSALAGRLDMGESIDVVEVALIEEKKKQKKLRRGRLEKPAGWITMQNLESFSSTVAKHEENRSQIEDVMAAVEEDKARGTRLFKAGQSYEAFEAWKRGAEKLEAFAPDGATDPTRKLKVALYNNMAQACLQCTDVEGASTEAAWQMADRVLQLDPENVKARFRRGLAFTNAEAWEHAIVDFEDVLALDPDNEAAAKQLRNIQGMLASAAPEPKPRGLAPAPVPVRRPPMPGQFGLGKQTPGPVSVATGSLLAKEAASILAESNPLAREAASILAESNPNAPPQVRAEAPRPEEEEDAIAEPNPNAPPQRAAEEPGPDSALDMAKATDPEEVIRKVHLDSQRLRKETLLLAEQQGCLEEWRERLASMQRSMAEWARHQLEDADMRADLEECWGPVFAAMTPQQREEFLSAHDFLSAMREEHGYELERLSWAAHGSKAEHGAELDRELRELAEQFGGMAEENGAELDELS